MWHVHTCTRTHVHATDGRNAQHAIDPRFCAVCQLVTGRWSKSARYTITQREKKDRPRASPFSTRNKTALADHNWATYTVLQSNDRRENSPQSGTSYSRKYRGAVLLTSNSFAKKSRKKETPEWSDMIILGPNFSPISCDIEVERDPERVSRRGQGRPWKVHRAAAFFPHQTARRGW